MIIDCQCQSCGVDFEIDLVDLVEEESVIVCPNCDAEAPQNLVEDFVSSLQEVLTCVSRLTRSFSLSLSIESEDLPGGSEEESLTFGADDADDDDADDDDDDLDDDDDDWDDE